MTDDIHLHIDGFGVEVFLPNQINYQQLNRTTLSSAIITALDHYEPWSDGNLERLILKPRYVLLPD